MLQFQFKVVVQASTFFVGCDSTSSFHGKGKAKPFAVLEKYPEFLATFETLGRTYDVTQELHKQLEKFTCHLYGQHAVDDVNLARYNIFSIGQFGEDTMPCTKDVLAQHTKRAAYQACIWKNALAQFTTPPAITDHGWVVTDKRVEIKWMTLPPAPDGILENANCGCKTGCATKRCACRKAALKCTSLCSCTNCNNAPSTDEPEESDIDLEENDDEDALQFLEDEFSLE